MRSLYRMALAFCMSGAACRQVPPPPGPLGPIADSLLENARAGHCLHSAARYAFDSVSTVECQWQVGDTAIVVVTNGRGFIERVDLVWRTSESAWLEDYRGIERSLARRFSTAAQSCGQAERGRRSTWHRESLSAELIGLSTSGDLELIFRFGPSKGLSRC